MSELDPPSPELDYETFDFAKLRRPGFADIQLSNTERQQMRALAEEGGPLWKIMQGLMNYKSVLENGMSVIDLFASDGLQKMAALQSEIKAIKWIYEMFQRTLTFVPPDQVEDQGS